MYKCSECFHSIGPMLDKNGRPELFICPRTGNAAHIIPQELQGRKVKHRKPEVVVQEKKSKKKGELIPSDPFEKVWA